MFTVRFRKSKPMRLNTVSIEIVKIIFTYVMPVREIQILMLVRCMERLQKIRYLYKNEKEQ